MELDTQSLHNNKKRLAVELSYKVRGGGDRAELDTQSLHNNKKRLAVELSYKVRGGIGQSWTPRASTTTRSGWLLSSPTR